uniref:Tyrosine-protein kinase n=1 Tax=Caenorhabditis tropicalis TaxID=1561998 RepID=A0A1I7T0T1_9PELO
MGDSNTDESINKRSGGEPVAEDKRQEITAVSTDDKGSDKKEEKDKGNDSKEDRTSDKKEDKGSDRKDEAVINKSTYIEKDVVEDEELYKSLQAMPFYHGFVPREDLGVILRNEGDYLIRVSEITTKKEGTTGIKRDIVLSACSSGGNDGETNPKDVKSEHNGERKMRNLVIRRYDGKFGIKGSNLFATIESLLANHHVSNQLESKENRFLKTPIELQPWEYRHSAVKLGDKLGEGAYGEVRKGVLQRKLKKADVAVKLMKGGELNKLKIREMMNEARLMRNFKHKNVVRFYGVAVVEQPLYILLELVNGGALN